MVQAEEEDGADLVNPTSSGRPKLVPRVFSIYQCIYLIRGTQARRHDGAPRPRAAKATATTRAEFVGHALAPAIRPLLVAPAGG